MTTTQPHVNVASYTNAYGTIVPKGDRPTTQPRAFTDSAPGTGTPECFPYYCEPGEPCARHLPTPAYVPNVPGEFE